MNPPPSKSRTPEAARLESDYLERLHGALRRLPAEEATEIEENVAEHINAALAELETDEVGLSQMATVLEELGTPDSLAPDPAEEAEPASTTAESPRNWETPPTPGMPEDFKAPPTLAGDREFLDRLFAGYLIVTIGLFIPVIDLYFCAVIGYAVIFWNLRKAPTPELIRGNPWAAIATLAALAMFPAALLTLAEEIFGILYIPIGLALGIGDIVLFWIVFGGLANWIDGKGMPVLAQKTRNRRIYYIVASLLIIMVAILVGVIAAAQNDETFTALISFAFLPLAWVINWFLILKPILAIRRNIH